jgi:leader peptidase (prepilin peptidase)/N-methyltransferase
MNPGNVALNWLFLGGALAAGWLAGALVNYVAEVLPTRRRLGPPMCPRCLAAETPAALRRYFGLGWRCQACQQTAPWRYRLTALAGLLAGGWLALAPSRFHFIAALALLTYFGVVVVIDLEHRLILNSVSLVGVGLGLWFGVARHGWVSTLLGGALGFGVMLALYFLGIGLVKLLNRVRAEAVDEEALGDGDVALAGVLGLMLGWPGIAAGLVLAILLGGGVSLIVLLVSLAQRRYHPSLAIPYGPFLVGSAFVLLFLRDIVFANL